MMCARFSGRMTPRHPTVKQLSSPEPAVAMSSSRSTLHVQFPDYAIAHKKMIPMIIL
jgi:hypothetical protein